MEIPNDMCFSPEEEQEYEKLKHAVETTLGRFSLILVRGNYPPQRNAILNKLESGLKNNNIVLQKLDFSAHKISNLSDMLTSVVGEKGSGGVKNFALALTGLEASIDMSPGEKIVPDLLASINVQRDLISDRFKFPIILWLTDHAMDLLSRRAPDFKDFYGAIFSFRCETEQPKIDLQRIPASVLSDSVIYKEGVFANYMIGQRIDILQDKITGLENEIKEGNPGLHTVLADSYRQLGSLYVNDNFPDQKHAIQYLKRALEIYKGIDESDKPIAEIHYQLGCANLLDAQYTEAQKHLETASDIYRNQGDYKERAMCLFEIGHIYSNLGNIPLATKNFEEALIIFDKTNSLLEKANCLNALSHLSFRLSNWTEAKEKAEASLQLFRDIDNFNGSADALLSLGNIHSLQKEYIEAINRYNEALNIFQQEDDRYGQAACLTNIGITLTENNAYEQAIQNLEQALFIFREIGNRHDESKTLSSLGNVFFLQGRTKYAIEYWQKSLAILNDIGDPDRVTYIESKISEATKSNGNEQGNEQGHLPFT